ncbi:MAG: DUF5312 domain-containing protein [Spirochaetaceae bacterium]|jgi:hypothetical protein|nr:DUF5312 domain-containing protein [Spirochaetaceae bacterium]
MNDNETFNKLSGSLGRDEKVQLLEKLKSNTLITDEPIAAESEKEDFNIDTLYAKLPWYKKILFFIIGLVLGKPKLEVFSANLINSMGKEIEVMFPGMFDWRNALLLPCMLQELVELKDAARFFSSALDSGVLANYGAFLIFLCSLEMPELHERLQKTAHPAPFFSSHPGLSDIKLKQIAISEAESVFNTLSDESRMLMYTNARALFCLKEIAFFLFDRLILAFQTGTHSQGAGQICPISVVRTQLGALNNILFSFKKMPSINLLTSMYVFVMHNIDNAKEIENDREMQKFTSGAEKALFTIRNFITKVPLTRLIRCGTKDLTYEPVEISGGEDWFSVLREKWLSIVTTNFNDYILHKKRTELISTLSAYFNGEALDPVEFIASETNPEGIPAKGDILLSFLLTFYRRIYMEEMHNLLRAILIDGEFIKKENRIDFTESYNSILKIEDMIKTVEKNLSSGGEWGKQWKQINQDVQSVAIKHRKTGMFFDEVNSAIDAIINSSKEAITTMRDVLSGITHTETGGKYDTLSNMSKFAGKGLEFSASLSSAVKKLKTAVQLISSMEEINVIS